MLREIVVRGRRNPLHFTIARRLKKAREARAWSSRKLALAAGLAEDTSLAIEMKGRVPYLDTIERLALALGLSPSFLAYGVEMDSPPPLPGGELRSAGCGARLEKLREHRGLSKLALGERAGIAGSALFPIETGRVSPSVATIEAVATALDVSPCWLAFGEGASPLVNPELAATEAFAAKFRPPRNPSAGKRPL